MQVRHHLRNFSNVTIHGFANGIAIHTGYDNSFNLCRIRTNKCGILLDGVTNGNIFKHCIVIENALYGIKISDSQAVWNKFSCCEFENNQPYIVSEVSNDNSIGVYLETSYFNNFEYCYFEKEQTCFVRIDTTSLNNIFTDCRFDYNPGLEEGAISPSIKLYATRGNIFTRCHQPVDNPNGYPSIIDVSNNADLSSNKFVHCMGLRVDPSIMQRSNHPTFINCERLAGGEGTTFNRLSLGRGNDFLGDSINTDEPFIDGVGTTDATLYTKGYGYACINSISAYTEITNIVGLNKGDVFVIFNYQNQRGVVLNLHNIPSCTFDNHRQYIVLWCSPMGDIVELLRNV